MKGYIDLYLLSVPKKNLAKYRTIAGRFGKMARGYGALRYREFTGDDLFPKGTVSFVRAAKPLRGETVVAAVVDFKSRTHRDRVMAKMFVDPRMNDMMKEAPLFNMDKMYYGGFTTLVES